MVIIINVTFGFPVRFSLASFRYLSCLFSVDSVCSFRKNLDAGKYLARLILIFSVEQWRKSFFIIKKHIFVFITTETLEQRSKEKKKLTTTANDSYIDMSLSDFILEDGLSGSSIDTGTRRIIRLDELSFVVRHSRRFRNIYDEEHRTRSYLDIYLLAADLKYKLCRLGVNYLDELDARAWHCLP